MSDICGTGGDNTGGSSSSGCIVPILCPHDSSWGLGGGWLPSGNPPAGGPTPPSPDPDPEDPEDDNDGEDDDDDDEENSESSTTQQKSTTSTTSSSTSSSTTTSTPTSQFNLCLTVHEGSGTISTTPTVSSTSSVSSATTTPVSQFNLCLTVHEGTGTISTTPTTSSSSSASPTPSTTTTPASQFNLCLTVHEGSGTIIESTPTTSSTSTSSAMCSLWVVDTSTSLCSCQSTTAQHTLSHQIMKPTDKDCSDINTFPMTSFMRMSSTPAATSGPQTTPTSSVSVSCYTQEYIGAHTTQTFCNCVGGPASDSTANLYSLPTSGPKCADLKTLPKTALVHQPEGPADPQICSNPGPSDDHGPGWCKCQKDDLVQWAAMPLVQGTATVLPGSCQAISTISFTTPTIAPPQTVSDFTEVDPMSRSTMYAEGVVITTDYGVGPATKTVGIGDPTEAYQPAVTSTLPNSDVELFPAKTIEGGTTTIAAEPTFLATQTAEAKCKYVTGPANYLYIIWDVFAWTSDDQDFASLANDFHGRLKARNCAVSSFQWKPYIQGYGPAFSFDTMELQDDCVRHAIQDVGGSDSTCSGSDWAGIHWWTDPDSIEGLVAHGSKPDDPHSTYEAQATGV